MRLLYYDAQGKVALTRNLADSDLPGYKYAILSHTWGPDDEEVTFDDLKGGTAEAKPKGFAKIRFCMDRASLVALKYSWVDSCCIDKKSSQELDEAINSMFRWYKNSEFCIVYLQDVSVPDSQKALPGRPWESEFRASRWFTRGWTLQELLAPPVVQFFSREGNLLGNKVSLQQEIHEITTIPMAALYGGDLAQFDIPERFRWAQNRQTKKEEDMAYCLLGIFNVFININYAEGRGNAERRLRKEINEVSEGTQLPLKPQKRSFILPFERNDKFTGREAQLEQLLNQICEVRDQTLTVAITGLGGVGKTQVAIELAYRLKAQHKGHHIFWIPVTSTGSLDLGYQNVAKALGVPSLEDKGSDAKKLVQEYLSCDNAGPWVIIFDNADDIDLWTSKTAQQPGRLLDCLPRSSLGSIVFTTRDQKAAVTFAGRRVIKIDEVDETVGTNLLRNYLINDTLLEDQAAVTSLLTRLTYLPLAISQAAAYINENCIDDLSTYTSLLDEQEQDVIELLSEDFEDSGRYQDVANPVATTWFISFAMIRQKSPLAVEYLSFMACVDSKNIPQSLLPPESNVKMTKALGTLLGYSFISINKKFSHPLINIHRLVHLATRNWLRKEGVLSQWNRVAFGRLQGMMQEFSEVTLTEWQPYLQHMHCVLRLYFDDKSHNYTEEDSNGIDEMLFNHGILMFLDSRYDEAERELHKTIKHFKAKSGDYSKDVFYAQLVLFSVYMSRGNKLAGDLGSRLLDYFVANDQLNYLLALSFMNSFISLDIKALNRMDKAEELVMRTLRFYETRSGMDHPDTIACTNMLARIYHKQGRSDEAEKLHMQVMEAYKRDAELDLGFVVKTMEDLISIYIQQYRMADLLALERQRIELFKRRLPGCFEHSNPTAIGSSSNPTTPSSSQKYQKAEEAQRAKVELSRKKYGSTNS